MSRLLAITFLSLLISTPFSCTAPLQSSPTTLILVRHAEKASMPERDPPLTDKGMERARELMRLLSQQTVGAIYSTPFQRTKQTVTPLSENQGVEITEYDPGSDVRIFLESVIASHPGQVVVICGHSNTIPSMLNSLTQSESWPQLNESDYNDIFVVSTVTAAKGIVTHLSYP